MKKYSFLAAGIFLLSACNISIKRTEEQKETTEATTVPAAGKTAKATDPVCGMDKDSTWTDHIVKGTDTSWFCSPHCKETFEKNPDKYKGKNEEKKG